MGPTPKAHVIQHTQEQRTKLLRLMHDVEPEAIILSLADRGAAEVLTAVVLKHTRKTNRLINFITTNFYMANFSTDLTEKPFATAVVALIVLASTLTTEEQLVAVDCIHHTIEVYNHTDLVITATSPESIYEDVLLQAFIGLMAVNKLKPIDVLIAENERKHK